MNLLFAPASPFARKCRVMIREAGGEGRVGETSVSASPTGSDAELIAKNPLGKIPCLVRDDGPAIYDSRVITRFLDERLDAGLYPEARLYDTLVLEALADGMMEACVLMTYEGRLRPPEQQSEVWVEAQWEKVARALDVLEADWTHELTKGPLDMAQIAVACALSYIDLRHGARGWRDEHGTLADWHAAFELRPAFAETRPE